MPVLLQIAIEANKGSVGRIAEQIGETVIQNNWTSYLTYARESNPSKSKVIKIGSKFDVYWHGLETRIFDNHCFSSRNATKKLIKTIKEINPDIIHLHHLHGYFINIEILFNYLKKVISLLFGLSMIVGLLQDIVRILILLAVINGK